MRLQSTVVSLLALGLFLAPSAHAQECKPLEQGMRFTFKFDGTLQELGETVSKTTCRKIEVPPKLRKLRIKLDPANPITPQELWDLFVQALQAYDVPIGQNLSRKDTKPLKKIDWKTRIAKGIKKVGDNRYELDHSLVESFFVTSDEALKQARFIPALEGGAFKGLKLLAVRPGSFYAAAGLKNGDIIRRIHNVQIDSIQTVLNLYERLKSRKTLSLEIERKGKSRTFTYKVIGS